MPLLSSSAPRVAVALAWALAGAGCSVGFEDNLSSGGIEGSSGETGAAGASGKAGGGRAGASAAGSAGRAGAGANVGGSAGRAGAPGAGAGGNGGGGAGGLAGGAGVAGLAGAAGKTGDGGNGGSGGLAGSTQKGGAGGTAGASGKAGSAGGTSGGGGNAGAVGCTPGATRCTGATREICQNGSFLAAEICASACEGGTCVGCLSGTKTCVDATTQSVCVAGAPVSSSCGALVCDQGECFACANASTACQGNDRVQCVNHAFVTVQSCGAGLCAPSGCLECTGTTASCQGTVPTTCAAGKIVLGADCGARGCLNGACTPECTGTERRCTDNILEVCDAGVYKLQETCTGDETCDATGAGSCKPCTPGETRCQGLQRQSCNGGTWQTQSVCNQICTKTQGCLSQVIDVFASDGKSCALVGENLKKRPFCWGTSPHGELGVVADRILPRYVAEAGVTTDIALGTSHMCVLSEDKVRCAGRNDKGQLGRGSTGADSSAFQSVSLSGKIVDVEAAGDTTCAQSSVGVLWCWGNFGGAGVPSPVRINTDTADVFAFRMGEGGQVLFRTSAAEGSTLRALGDNGTRQLGFSTPGASIGYPGGIVSGSPGAKRMAGGGLLLPSGEGIGHSCSIDTTGKLGCWGLNDAGQVGPSGLGETTVTLEGVSYPVFPTPVFSDIQLEEVKLGERHTCVRRSSGVVTCWGQNPDGRAGLPLAAVAPRTTLTLPGSAVNLTAGVDQSCALVDQGGKPQEVYCWGANDRGQLGDAAPGGGAPRKVVLADH